ncbi:rRNA maturation RNase YbeY [Petrocella sp. FN5]|uniref:rRNA maturation RNase YbeY n=1 Tax=Petrocella sp. FN5 TaxID=3032002 RepID=UPI0023D98B82|nr:rRNA maturation RNase YbeY [Petrocella sp. FN5]MDF1618182.1 rRNA maturation RNase YbeY [Petrocella sp. FN5]
MSVYIEWLYGDQETALNPLIEDAIRYSLTYEGISEPVELSVTIMSNDEIQEINLDQRGMNKPTDVLSFPMVNIMIGEQFSQSIKHEPKNPETDEVYVGDIVISWDKVLEQSKLYGHSKERELGFLVVHSMLHLMGYDHETEAEEAIMIHKQKEILEDMGMKR